MPQSKQEDELYIDVNLIPEYTQRRLAAATLRFIKDILKNPGGREALDKKIAELGL